MISSTMPGTKSAGHPAASVSCMRFFLLFISVSVGKSYEHLPIDLSNCIFSIFKNCSNSSGSLLCKSPPDERITIRSIGWRSDLNADRYSSKVSRVSERDRIFRNIAGRILPKIFKPPQISFNSKSLNPQRESLRPLVSSLIPVLEKYLELMIARAVMGCIFPGIEGAK